MEEWLECEGLRRRKEEERGKRGKRELRGSQRFLYPRGTMSRGDVVVAEAMVGAMGTKTRMAAADGQGSKVEEGEVSEGGG